MEVNHTTLYHIVKRLFASDFHKDVVEYTYEVDGKQYILLLRTWQLHRAIPENKEVEAWYQIEILFRFMESSYKSMAEFSLILNADDYMFLEEGVKLSSSFMLTEIDYKDKVVFGDDTLSHHIMVLALGG